MSTLGERIRFAREQKGFLQGELAKLIGVKSSGVISNWENDLNKPDAEKIVRLCSVLDISASYLLDYYGKPENEFTTADINHLKKYHELDDFGRKTIDIILDRESERVKTLNQQRDRIKELETRPIIIEKHNDAMMRIYTYLRKIACAGNGFYFDDIPTETIEAPYMEGAEFIVGVNGDSMEPTYKDGDLVYVEKRQIIETGEIGIFVVNNECFIKEAGEEGLISHNPKYSLIPGTENIQCIGKVLAKVPVLDN